MKRILSFIILGILLIPTLLALDLPLLEGEMSMADILDQLPEYKTVYDRYTPAAQILEILPPLQDVDIYVIFGTWCSDSLDQVPPFMNILTTLSFPSDRIFYIAVNRKMEDPDGLAADFDIQRVPTFIFMRKGKELGRIIETPNKSLEEDMLDIFSKPSASK